MYRACGYDIIRPSKSTAPESSGAEVPRMVDATQADRGSDAALQNLNSVLTADEKLEAWAIQRRVFALEHRRVTLGATTGRFLALVRPLFGGFDLTDVRWQDLKEVHIQPVFMPPPSVR
jgi:hypothetical protein